MATHMLKAGGQYYASQELARLLKLSRVDMGRRSKVILDTLVYKLKESDDLGGIEDITTIDLDAFISTLTPATGDEKTIQIEEGTDIYQFGEHSFVRLKDIPILGKYQQSPLMARIPIFARNVYVCLDHKDTDKLPIVVTT